MHRNIMRGLSPNSQQIELLQSQQEQVVGFVQEHEALLVGKCDHFDWWLVVAEVVHLDHELGAEFLDHLEGFCVDLVGVVGA